MMQLRDIRISNYRSIKEEQSINFSGSTTLIGPNNSGKTNALKAIALLFGGYENKFGYECTVDIPSDRASRQTSIIGNFSIDVSEKWFWDKYDKLHEMHETTRTSNDVTLYLYFTSTNTPVYSFFTNTKRPADKRADYSRILRGLVADFINKFSIQYIPSEKSIGDLYAQLLLNRVSEKAALIFSSTIENLKKELGIIESAITKNLSAAGISTSKVHLEIPDDDIKNIVGAFNILISDSAKTFYTQKGRGLQAAVFYASLEWINERIKNDQKIPIWLIEEPESYMHPELAKNCKTMLSNLSKESLVVVSTHSMQFLPRNPDEMYGFIFKETATQITKFEKFDDACNSLKKSLGLRFSDYYSLGETNIFVEGKTDIYIIQAALMHIKNISSLKYPLIEKSIFIEKGGVSSLVGFLKAVYEHVRKEVAAVSVFDGDDAGIKARKELQGFFSKRGEFSPNFDFVSVRNGYPIEGVFPDSWIIEIYNNHPSWFKSWSVDAQGVVEPFALEDDKKENYARAMINKLLQEKDVTKISLIISLLDAIENALHKQHEKLHGESFEELAPTKQPIKKKT